MNNQSYNFNYFSLSADIYIFSVLRHFSPAFIDLLVSYNQHIRTKLMQLIKKIYQTGKTLLSTPQAQKKAKKPCSQETASKSAFLLSDAWTVLERLNKHSAQSLLRRKLFNASSVPLSPTIDIHVQSSPFFNKYCLSKYRRQ